MRAGNLRHRISIQKPVVTRNNLGGVDKSWQEFATAKAAVTPLRAREYFAARQVQAETTHLVTIRYITGITSEMRVIFNGRVVY